MRPARSRALLARFRKLEDPRVRRQSGSFVAEGVGCLIAALETRARILEIAYCPPLFRSRRVSKHLNEVVNHVRAEKVDRKTFCTLSRQREPSGVAMILRERWIPLPRMPTGTTHVHVAVRAVRSPGNLGTLLRTMEAIDAGGLITLGPGIDPYSPDVLRGSMGSVLRRPVVRTDHAALRRWARVRGLRIVGASPGHGQPYDDRDRPLRGPLVLVLGEERKGLSVVDQALCDSFVHIPILGGVDSLNVAVSGSILLYETLRVQQSATGLNAP